MVIGDARRLPFADNVAQCVVTSPPYYGLRDYGVTGQIGLEHTPAAYVAELVAVFREVWRVLRDDGVVWLNLGDSYASATKGSGGGWALDPKNYISKSAAYGARRFAHDVKDKDLLGIPWRVAFALQDAGWYLRSDVIWHKLNPMPESVTDRPTKAHEYVFLLSKSARYFYDAEAIAETANSFGRQHTTGVQPPKVAALKENGFHGAGGDLSINYEREKRNARSVWTISSKPFSGAHFATMPPALAERCIRAGSRPGDVILDPFGGSGTTERVAIELGRRFIGTELNPAYLALRGERVAEVPVRLI